MKPFTSINFNNILFSLDKIFFDRWSCSCSSYENTTRDSIISNYVKKIKKKKNNKKKKNKKRRKLIFDQILIKAA